MRVPGRDLLLFVIVPAGLVGMPVVGRFVGRNMMMLLFVLMLPVMTA